MKRRVLLRYLSGHFLSNTLGAILGFTALIELLDVLNNATDILDRKLGVLGLGHYVLLRLPATLDQAITLGVLIGGVLTFIQAARHSELTAMRWPGSPSINSVGCCCLASRQSLSRIFLSPISWCRDPQARCPCGGRPPHRRVMTTRMTRTNRYGSALGMKWLLSIGWRMGDGA